MATAEPQPRMTAEAFWERHAERPDRYDARDYPDGYPDLELWDGVVVEGEVTNYRHQETLFWWRLALDGWVRAKGGRLWLDGGVKFGPHDVRGPDLMAWWSGQPFDPDRMLGGAPDLAIEIVSPRPRDVRRDREEKLVDYCAHGIPHYWIVEPLHRVFEAYLRHPAAQRRWEYRRTVLATTGVVEVMGFRGLALDLDACWRAADG
jgi:Uma2 family endonuclease